MTGPGFAEPRLDGGDLAFLVPLWRRTSNMARLHDSVRATVPDATVYWVVSHDDEHAQRAVVAHLEREGDDLDRAVVVPWAGGSRGDYARKVNAGYRTSTEPVLFTGADDLCCRPGWYHRARPLLDVPAESVEVLPGGALLVGPARVPRVGVVGTNDLANPRTAAGEHSTHSLVARWYADQGACADQDRVVYYEGYWHDYCDDELVQTARARNAWEHAPDAHVEHFHPIVGPRAAETDDDDVYRLGRSRSRISRRIFLERARRLGFGEGSRRRVYRAVR